MRRNRVALLLALTLLAAAPGAASPLDWLWLRFAALWGSQAFLDEGCGWDPNGVLLCEPAHQPKAGVGFDPDGGGTATSPAAGCGWDPDGSPNGAFQTNAGFGFDPNGRCEPVK